MHLTKYGKTYTGNTKKYFSRDRAIERLESAVFDFLHIRKAADYIENLLPIYDQLSLKDQAEFKKQIEKLGLWAVEMEARTLPEEVS